MAMFSPFVITLSTAEQCVLAARAHSATCAHRDVIRARIVLAAAHGATNSEIAMAVGMHVDTVRKWRRRFTEVGLLGLDDRAAPHVHLGPGRRGQGAPDFGVKAARALDLYARTWCGRPLRADEYVISADEKSQLQALHRRHRGQPPAPGLTRRVEFEYRRGGTLAYFAAYDVHRAHVIGQIAAKTGIEPFEKLVTEVMSAEPYASARRVFWVVDNGSSSVHRRLAATLVHLPIHASWLIQVEIYFSILQRKAISPNDFKNLNQLTDRILSFQDRYSATATPFDWTYTRDDLNAFLHRLAA